MYTPQIENLFIDTLGMLMFKRENISKRINILLLNEVLARG
jgi:hypothetical protein